MTTPPNPEPRTLNPEPCPTWNDAKYRLAAAGQGRPLAELLRRDLIETIWLCVDRWRGGPSRTRDEAEATWELIVEIERLGLANVPWRQWPAQLAPAALERAIVVLQEEGQPQSRRIALDALADALDALADHAPPSARSLRLLVAVETFSAAVRGILFESGPLTLTPDS
jgi:hypothetical protein